MRQIKLAVVLFSSIAAVGFGQPVDSICKNGGWSDCALAVQKALKTKPSDPSEVVRIASAWAVGYDKQYEFLRKQGRLETSTPDSEKIASEVADELNPVKIGIDQLKDALLKKWLPRAAAVMEHAAPAMAGFLTFFTSSAIASDYQELRFANTSIQRSVLDLLRPSLLPSWQQEFQRAVKAAQPRMKVR